LHLPLVSSQTKENGGSPLSSAQIRHKALDEITTPETAYLADYLEQHKHEIIERWRKAAENEPAQAERLAKMDDGELLDHLPALTEAVIGVLRGEKESLVEEDARLHGHQRRLDGYSVMDLLWELTTFRRLLLALLDEASDEIPDWIPVSGSRTILDLQNVCARVSIDQHVKETEQEFEVTRRLPRPLKHNLVLFPDRQLLGLVIVNLPSSVNHR
jgi:hypothetical protein